MKVNIIALATISLTGTTIVAETPTYSYRLPAYPTQAAACHETARRLGQSFAEATGVSLKQSSCDASRDGRSDLRFVYEAAQPVLRLSTAWAASPVEIVAGYATEAACQAALPTESEVFTSHVGRAPVFAYCYRDPAENIDPWVLRLDAFGEAEQQPLFAGTYVFGRPLDMTRDEFLQAVTQHLSDGTRDVRFVKLRSMLAYERLSVFYYGTTATPMAAPIYAELETKAQCREQRSGMEQTLTEAGVKVLLTYCAESLGRYEAQAVILGEAKENRLSVERFSSYATCAAQRAEVIRHYRDDLSYPVVGGFCSLTHDETKEWVVSLVEQAATARY